MKSNRSVLIFGVGELQRSIIERAKQLGLFVVGVDPRVDACCKDDVDAFEVLDGQDFENTILIAKKYHVSAVVTAATDKPLVMMARVAKELDLPFYSEETARISTDKYLMKERFRQNDIPCASDRLISSVDEAEDFLYPLIVKPRDNSGSRGVMLCNNKQELKSALNEASHYTKKSTFLVEEFIEGQEYSVEALHFNAESWVIQFTEKKVTPFPYSVELGHIQPANISVEQKQEIERIVAAIGKALSFENCASHTELKINAKGIFVIETSPRLGGDYITSTLVPLSTGINIEDQLLNIALGESVDLNVDSFKQKSSGIRFFSLNGKKIDLISLQIGQVDFWDNIFHFAFKLKEHDTIPLITSSLSRYGEFIVQTDNREQTVALLDKYEEKILKLITVSD